MVTWVSSSYPSDKLPAMEYRRLMTLAWGAVVVLLVIDLVWFPFARLTFAAGNFPYLLWSALALVGLYAVLGIVSYRLRRLQANRFVLGRWMARIADGARLFILASFFGLILAIGLVTFSYLTASLGLPLRDAELDAIDRAMGFDWLAFLALANASPAIAAILRMAYYSAGAQLLALYLFLSFARRRERLAEFLAVLAISSLLTGLVVTFVPADDGYGVYAPTPEMFGSFGGTAGMRRHEILMSLRGPAPVLEFGQTQGIVVFPSFHTTLAIITTYAVRGLRYVFVPVCILNAVVIVATLPEGGHHLVDLIGGALVAALTIAVVRRVARGDVKRAPTAFGDQQIS
jgi:membrane-associated phospholipid phosphatase